MSRDDHDASSGGSDEHVLFVDAGDPAVTLLVDELVAEFVRARVTRVCELEHALACLASDPPTLVVVDLRMPRLTAWAFLREKGRIGPTSRIPTVLLQTAAPRGTALVSRAAGVVGHIDVHAGARALLRFRDRAQRRATDAQLVRAWYRSDLLAELTEVLGNALERDVMLERAAQLMVPSFAEWCVVRTRLPEAMGTATECEVRVHHDPSRAALLEGLVLQPMERAFDTGHSELHRIGGWADRLAVSGSDAGAVALHDVGTSCVLTLPLTSKGTTLGTIAFGRHPGDYDALDHELAAEAAHRIAMAIDLAAHHALAQRAARLREDLLAIVSHDLRIPLTTIMMVATKVRRSPGAEENTRRDADTILRNLRRMDRMIRDLLDCSRLETGRLRVDVGRTRIVELLVQAVEAARPLAGSRSVRLEVPARDEDPLVSCDKERVLQILDNLIGNALKFTPEQGTVTVRLDVASPDARVTVTDTGCGIADEHLPHLFDRYWQGRDGDPFDARRGVGLGLFITKGLVEAQRGNVTVTSRRGAGSSFAFTLPLDTGSSARSGFGVGTIVVVDDDLSFRRELIAVLQHEGHDVVGFAHGRAALEYMTTTAPPGLVITELTMPVMNGWQLAAAMSVDPRLAGVPIMTVSATSASGRELRQLVTHIAKPTTAEDVLGAVNAKCVWLASGTHRIGEHNESEDVMVAGAD